VRPLRQPAARPAGRRRDRPDGPAHHAGRRVALGAQPERAARRRRHAALLGGRRRGCLQYRKLVRGARGGRGIRALASRGARRAAALRRRHDRADRAGIRVRYRPGVLARACPAGPRPRALAAHGRGPLGGRLDVPGRLHGAAVNVYFHTFGCKANQYDTELVRQAFADQGAVLVDDPAAADLAVVNSCTVTAESETKLRRFVRGLARRGAKLETIVMGCAAALDEGRIAGAQCASRGDRAHGGAYRHLRARPVVRVDRPRGRAPGFTKAGLWFGCPRGRAPGFTKAGLWFGCPRGRAPGFTKAGLWFV